jgi:hypothetical protein
MPVIYWCCASVESGRTTHRPPQPFPRCKDETESGKQHMSHIEIYQAALALEFSEQVVLTQTANAVVQHKAQKHARTNHSYLWAFRR